MEIRDLTRRLEIEYRWVHGAAHARRVTDEPKVALGGPDDVTASIVTSKDLGRMRGALRRATADAVRALGACEQAAAALRAGSARDPGGVRFEALRYPRTALQEELKESRQAKARREEQGGGFGES